MHLAGTHTLALHLAIVTHWLSRQNSLKAVLSTPALMGRTLSPSRPQAPLAGTPSLLKSLWTTLQMAGTTAPTPPPHAPTHMGSSPGWNHLLASRGTRGGGGRCGVSIGDRTILFFHHPLPCIPTPSPALPSRHFSSPFPTSMKLLRGTLSLFRRRGTQVPAGRGTCLPTLGSLENSKGYIQLVMANNPGSSMTEGLLEVHPDLDVAVITCVR